MMNNSQARKQQQKNHTHKQEAELMLVEVTERGEKRVREYRELYPELGGIKKKLSIEGVKVWAAAKL